MSAAKMRGGAEPLPQRSNNSFYYTPEGAAAATSPRREKLRRHATAADSFWRCSPL